MGGIGKMFVQCNYLSSRIAHVWGIVVNGPRRLANNRDIEIGGRRIVAGTINQTSVGK